MSKSAGGAIIGRGSCVLVRGMGLILLIGVKARGGVWGLVPTVDALIAFALCVVRGCVGVSGPVIIVESFQILSFWSFLLLCMIAVQIAIKVCLKITGFKAVNGNDYHLLFPKHFVRKP